MRIATIFFCVSVSVLVISTHALASPWSVGKESWTASDEKNYSEFVAALGASGCNTVDRCLKSAANPYRKSDPAGSFFDADCGKFPYLLRGYFAWKNGLPFSYASGVRSADGHGHDIRYSPNGNVVTNRRSIVSRGPDGAVDGYRALKLMQSEVDSAMYRIHPARDGVDRGLFSDFFSTHMDRESVRPGTMIYDVAGHVVVVYRVETDGRVRYFDAHPDKTVSHGVFGEKFARSRPGAGGGFKNFRSLRLVGASVGSSGYFYGGTVTAAPLSHTPGYSEEQFFGNEASAPYTDNQWRNARFQVNGRQMQWFDFVRASLAIGELKYHPVEELQNAMDSICGDIQDRVTSVQAALTSGIQNHGHPGRLPNNIYGTDGEWEEFSSPSRDARLKTSFKEIRDRIQQMVDLYHHGDASVVYDGQNIKGDLLSAYNNRAAACTIQYRRTSGDWVTLTYDDILARLFKLSFDPYHCAELRWGATSPDELASCSDSSDKLQWYRAEQRLRNQIDRPYDVNMGFSVHDLISAAAHTGVDQAPDVDLRGYLSQP